MPRIFYLKEEENVLDSLNNYEFLLKDYKYNPPTLKEALFELFRNGGASEKAAKEIYNHLYKCCNEKLKQNKFLIMKLHKNISYEDALIISSYTYEPKKMYAAFCPYKLLNTFLVTGNRKRGVQNAEKYLFLLLSALRKMNKYKKKYLYRCINCHVKLEKDPNNPNYVPYKIGNYKVFWAFTSTSDDEDIAENFLGNGIGTKFTIIGDNLWGYDISPFNLYDETEFLLEPERQYKIIAIKKGNIMEVVCKIIGDNKILGICDYSIIKKKVSI